MYESYFGLTEKPFNLTPDPRFLYPSAKHREALAHLKYAIENRTGFVMVSGEVGTGKTTICRSLLNDLDAETEVAFIFNPMLSPKELLRAINDDFGIPSRGETIKELIDELNAYLLDRNSEGKNCVLVIDEAQNLRPEVLEQVRLLSNLETETQKLLQIVLIGQPELARNLELPELRQLNQRITARYHLMALNEHETLQYIAYRIRVAGGRGRVRFSRSAVHQLFKLSHGTPRMINALADRCLLVAFTRDTSDISKSIVKQASNEIFGKPSHEMGPMGPAAPAIPEESEEEILYKESPEKSTKSRRPRPMVVLVGVAIIIAAVYITMTWQGFTNNGVTLRAPEQAKAPAIPAVGPVAKTEPVEKKTPETAPAPQKEKTSETASSAPTPEAPQNPTPAAPAPAPAANPKPEPAKNEPAKTGTDELETPLTALDPVQARLTAITTLIKAWGVEVNGEGPASDEWEDLLAFVEAHGFAMTVMYPDVEKLCAINLPALVRVKSGPAGEKTDWVALAGVDNDNRLILTLSADERITVSQETFTQHFALETLIPWKDPAPDQRTMGPGVTGFDVRQLQERLGALRWYAGPVTGKYDDATAEAVRAIQRQTGLKVDGIAGREVRMVLTSWLSGGATPALRKVAPFNPTQLGFSAVNAPVAEIKPATVAEKPAQSEEKPVKEEQKAEEKAETKTEEPAPAPEPTEKPAEPPVPEPAPTPVPEEKPAPAPEPTSSAKPEPALPEQSLPATTTETPESEKPALQAQRVSSETLPPPAQPWNREMTPPSVATLPLAPRESAGSGAHQEGVQ